MGPLAVLVLMETVRRTSTCVARIVKVEAGEY